MHEEAKLAKQGSLIIRPSTGLVTLPDGGSSALSEIIGRSIAQIQTDRALADPMRRAGEEQEFEIAPGVMIVMCWIAPGAFLMESWKNELGQMSTETDRRITITQGFWLGKYQVTQAQWEAVMGSNPSWFHGSELPVDSVSWDEISEPEGFLAMVNRFAGSGGCFSLPTQAQWEHACRAGTESDLNNGKNLTTIDGYCPNLDEVAWYQENSGGSTHIVGQKKGNAWGLHDMHGNVSEWCGDWYGNDALGPLMDPRLPYPSSMRLYLGGSYFDHADYCHVANRMISNRDKPSSTIGFRVARSSALQ